jgi:hypothetical protein
MKSKLTIFIVTLFLSIWTSSVNAQTTVPKGKAQLIEFTNANAKFTVPDGKTWVIYNVFSDYMTNVTLSNNRYDGEDIRIFFKSINGVAKTDLTKNLYGTQLYRSTNASTTVGMPIIMPEKTTFELIITFGSIGKLKLYNSTGYLSIIETDN